MTFLVVTLLSGCALATSPSGSCTATADRLCLVATTFPTLSAPKFDTTLSLTSSAHGIGRRTNATRSRSLERTTKRDRRGFGACLSRFRKARESEALRRRSREVEPSPRTLPRPGLRWALIPTVTTSPSRHQTFE